MQKHLIAIFVISTILSLSPAKAQVAGLWEFHEASSLTKATIGNNLILRGSGQSYVAGINGADGAVAVQSGTYYQCQHGIAANGGGSFVNQFTLLFDVMYPPESVGRWRAFYQSGYDTYNDSDYFIRPSDESWGVGVLGYTDNSAVGEWYSSPSTWYRVILTVNLNNNPALAFHDLYINGALKGRHNKGNLNLDGRFALYPSSHSNPYLVLCGDNDGEDALMYFSNIAIWDHPLTPDEIADLGGPGDPIIAGHAGVRIIEPDAGISVKEGEDFKTYQVVLRAAPSAEVKIKATPTDEQIDIGAGAGQPVVLYFTTANWDVPQAVQVLAFDDEIYEGKTPAVTTISHTAVSEDKDYESLSIASIEISVTDNELTCGDWGFLSSDLNKDCYVDFLDFAIFAELWLER